MPAYNATVPTQPQMSLPQALSAIAGQPSRVWDSDAFNADGCPWIVQTKTAVIPTSVSTMDVNFDVAPTAGNNVHFFVIAKDLGGPPNIDVTFESANVTAPQSINNPYSASDFVAHGIAGGDTAVTFTTNNIELLIIMVEISGAASGTNSTALAFAGFYGSSDVLSPDLTVGSDRTLVMGFFYNGQGGFDTKIMAGSTRVPILAKVQSGSDSGLFFAYPNPTAGDVEFDIHTLSASQAAIVLMAAEQGTISATPNIFSQQVLLASDGKFPRHFSVNFGFSADPGAFSLQVQVADVDDPLKYVTLDTLTSGLTDSFQGRAEYVNITGKFVRLYMASLANAVLATADIISG